MGASHRRRDARVTHEFLDRGEVYTGEDKAGREGVAQIMKSATWGAGPLNRFQKGRLHILDGRAAIADHMPIMRPREFGQSCSSTTIGGQLEKGGLSPIFGHYEVNDTSVCPLILALKVSHSC